MTGSGSRAVNFLTLKHVNSNANTEVCNKSMIIIGQMRSLMRDDHVLKETKKGIRIERLVLFLSAIFVGCDQRCISNISCEVNLHSFIS